MNNKFFQVNCKIQFNKQGGKGIPNLVYKISFSDKTGKILHTFNGKTDQNGATAPLLLDKNGTLKIMVEGYKTPFSKKGVMEPPFVKHNNIIEINESALDKNARFMTKEQYDKKKLEIKAALQKKISNTNHYEISYRRRNQATLAELGESYEEFKKARISRIPKLFLRSIKTYTIFQFIDSRGQGIAIRYQIFSPDKEKPIVNMKPALCDKNGYTQQAWTSESSISQKHNIKYVIGNEAKVLTGYTTITCIDDPQFKYKVKIGITQAVTNPDKDNKVGLGPVYKPPIIINPHTNEVLLLQPELYREFDAKTKLLSDAVMSVHKTNKQLTRAIQERKINEIEELEKRLNISQKQAITKINKEFKQKADLTEVWIIESRAGAKPNGKKYEIQRRYLNQTEYEKYEKKKINKNSKVEITTNETKVGVSNIGKIKASFNKLAENLSNEIKAKPSKELKNLSDEVFSVKGEIGGDKAIYNLIGGLGGEISEEYETSSGINVKQEAQWMRLVAGAPRGEGSITATNKGVKMNLNADASVKWTLFEGTKEWRKFFPSEVGWLMEYENYHLGEIRFLVGMEISGFAGANLGVSANVSVDITHQGTSQIIRGTTRDPKRSMKTMMDKAKGAKLKVADGNLDIMEENASKSDHAAAEISAFAGVQVSGVFKGNIEWFDPGLEDNDKAKFVTVAAASIGGGVSAGVGATGQFQIGYSAVSNTFRILVAAHLCWGVGAKGTAAFDVGHEHILNFAGFIKSQLFYAGFKTLAHVNAAAFLMLSQALAYCIGNDNKLTIGYSALAVGFTKWIRSLDIDQTRLQTARRVNSSQGRKELIYATPETKGILLYAVSHWTDRTAPIIDSRIGVSFSGIEVNVFPERKNAIINILKTCVSAAEWKNTIQHMHPEGTKLTESQLGKVEGDIVRFLNYDTKHTTESEERVKTILYCINNNIEYEGEANSWLQQYLKYRKGAAKVTQHLNYILVRNQDDIRFKQLEIMQNLPGGFADEPVLMASNLEILAPFENDDVPEYKA